MYSKKCSICNEVKGNEDFYKNKSNKIDGLNPYCKECTKQKSRQYQRDNKESRKKYYQERYKKNRQHYISIVEEWNKNNPDRKKQTQKKWRQKNKGRVNEYRTQRMLYKTHYISETEWFECLDFFNSSCAYCGISEGEAFELYGQLLHKEHVEHDGANDITNCVPACKSCNGSKRTAQLNDWYNTSNYRYSDKRYQKIVDWLVSFSIN